MKIIQIIDKAIIKIITVLLMIAIAAMVLFAAWQVLCRYVLFISVPYAEEFARLAIVWCIYLGAALAVRFREHMMVVALTDALPRAVQLLLKVLVNVLIVYLGYVMIRYGIEHVNFTAGDITTSLRYPRNVFYIPAPISGALICAYSISNILADILAFRKKETILRGDAPEV